MKVREQRVWAVFVDDDGRLLISIEPGERTEENLNQARDVAMMFVTRHVHDFMGPMDGCSQCEERRQWKSSSSS